MNDDPYRGTVIVIEDEEYIPRRGPTEVVLLVILWLNVFLVGVLLRSNQ